MSTALIIWSIAFVSVCFCLVAQVITAIVWWKQEIKQTHEVQKPVLFIQV